MCLDRQWVVLLRLKTYLVHFLWSHKREGCPHILTRLGVVTHEDTARHQDHILGEGTLHDHVPCVRDSWYLMGKEVDINSEIFSDDI